MKTRIKFALIVVTLIASMAAGTAIAYADAGGPVEEVIEVPAFVDVLALIAEGVGAGFVLAFLAERFEWFQKLSSKAKWWVIFCVSIAAPIAAQALLDFVPADVWAQIEPYWQALALGFLSWAGSQAAHLGHKALAQAGRMVAIRGKDN